MRDEVVRVSDLAVRTCQSTPRVVLGRAFESQHRVSKADMKLQMLPAAKLRLYRTGLFWDASNDCFRQTAVVLIRSLTNETTLKMKHRTAVVLAM